MSAVSFTAEGPVARISINNPPVNALSADVLAGLDDAATRAADPSIRAVVVYSEPHFAAGADIKRFKSTMDAGSRDVSAVGVSEVNRHIEQLAKPVISAVRGFALGGGLELAMSADFIYLGDDARVGQPEILLGIIPGAGGTQRLSRLVGFQRAKELVYTGRHVSADEAMEIGIGVKLVSSEELLDVAMTDAAEWATKATVAIAAAKRAMNEGWGRPMDDALALEREGFADSFASDDAKEGVDAFVNKRSAKFTGR